MQLDAPVVGCEVPAPQLVQVTAAAAEYNPAVQSTQPKEPAAPGVDRARPEAQALQADEPDTPW